KSASSARSPSWCSASASGENCWMTPSDFCCPFLSQWASGNPSPPPPLRFGEGEQNLSFSPSPSRGGGGGRGARQPLSGPDRTRTCNQGIMPTTSAFAARRAPVRGLDCAFTVDATSSGASVSSLYTFPASRAWLGVGMGGQGESSPAAFADFTEVLRHDFSGRDPVGGWRRAGRARSVSSARTPPLPSPLLCR